MSSESSGERVTVYEGWAPTIQDEAALHKAEAWLKPILDLPSDEFYVAAFDRAVSGGAIERLLWEINWLGGTVTCVCDQWVRVDTVGTIKGHEVETHIQGDTFLLALAETFRWWREFGPSA